MCSITNDNSSANMNKKSLPGKYDTKGGSKDPCPNHERTMENDKQPGFGLDESNLTQSHRLSRDNLQ